MKTINRHNYEAFFLDYLEGNLPASRTDELISFLRDNPDLQEELQNWEEVVLQPDEQLSMAEKDRLKKQPILPGENHFDELCIARMEGDLSATETQAFENYLKANPERQHEFNLYQKTRLTPDYAQQYPHRKSLKKGRTVNLASNSSKWLIPVAASIALLLGLIFSFQTNTSNNFRQLSNKVYFKDYKNLSGFEKPPATSANLIKSFDDVDDINIAHNTFSYNVNIESLSTSTSRFTSLSKLEKQDFSSIQGALQVANISKFAQIRQTESFPALKSKLQKDPATLSHYLASNASSGKSTNSETNSFSLLDLADYGFQGISKLTGKELELKRYYNQKGDLKGLALKTEKFTVKKKVKN